MALAAAILCLARAAYAQDGAADEKASRTPAQEKIDSQLIMAVKRSRGEALPTGAPSMLPLDAAGRAVIDLQGSITPELVQRIEALGGSVVSQFPHAHSLRAVMPVAALEPLASEAAVRFLKSAVPAQTRLGSPPTAPSR